MDISYQFHTNKGRSHLLARDDIHEESKFVNF